MKKLLITTLTLAILGTAYEASALNLVISPSLMRCSALETADGGAVAGWGPWALCGGGQNAALADGSYKWEPRWWGEYTAPVFFDVVGGEAVNIEPPYHGVATAGGTLTITGWTNNTYTTSGPGFRHHDDAFSLGDWDHDSKPNPITFTSSARNYFLKAPGATSLITSYRIGPGGCVRYVSSGSGVVYDNTQTSPFVFTTAGVTYTIESCSGWEVDSSYQAEIARAITNGAADVAACEADAAACVVALADSESNLATSAVALAASESNLATSAAALADSESNLATSAAALAACEAARTACEAALAASEANCLGCDDLEAIVIDVICTMFNLAPSTSKAEFDQETTALANAVLSAAVFCAPDDAASCLTQILDNL